MDFIKSIKTGHVKKWAIALGVHTLEAARPGRRRAARCAPAQQSPRFALALPNA